MLVRYDFRLRLVISGGQTGADVAGLEAANSVGLMTGGFAPDNFMTVLGPNYLLRDRYALVEGGSYPTRTEKNVCASDGTIRFATNFFTAGEQCTLRAINKHHKPYLDIKLPSAPSAATEVVDFIQRYAITVLNVAGNADRDKTATHFEQTFEILVKAFNKLDSLGLLAKKDSNDTSISNPIV